MIRFGEGETMTDEEKKQKAAQEKAKQEQKERQEKRKANQQEIDNKNEAIIATVNSLGNTQTAVIDNCEDKRQSLLNTVEDFNKDLALVNTETDYDTVGTKWKANLNDEWNKAQNGSATSSNTKSNTKSSAFTALDSELGLQLELPKWGYANFINERNSWQKSLHSLTSERGWFYFKIFFKFNTGYGLFGNIMYDNQGPYKYLTKYDVDISGREKTIPTNNSATKYLAMISKTYKETSVADRLLALFRFTGILSYINCEAPWFFSSVSNLNNAVTSYTTQEQFNKDKYIDITCMEDAVDMRLGSLFDLYRFACYDSVNCKEVIPENLRKFDMSIAIFSAPIKHFHTGMMGNSLKSAQFGSNSKTVLNQVLNTVSSISPTYGLYKSLNGNPASEDVFDEMMSFQLFQFKNCEFDVNSFNGYYQSISNEQGFTLGKNTIRINFDRCFKYNMNEWNEMLFGPDRFFYDNGDTPKTFPVHSEQYLRRVKSTNNKWLKRIDAIRNSYGSTAFMPEINRDQYKALIDFGEYAINDCLITDDMSEHYGNLYNPEGKKDLYGYNSDYFNNKLKWLKKGVITGNIYGDSTNTESQEYKNRIKHLHNSGLDNNIYGGLADIPNQTDNKENFYSYKKLQKFKLKKDLGKLYGESTSIIGDSDYLHTKMFWLHKGIISGNLYPDADKNIEGMSINSEGTLPIIQSKYQFNNTMNNAGASIAEINNEATNHLLNKTYGIAALQKVRSLEELKEMYNKNGWTMSENAQALLELNIHNYKEDNSLKSKIKDFFKW